MARRIPEHLQELFWAFVMAQKHGFKEIPFESVRGLADRIRILPEGVDPADIEAHEIANEAAGWSL